MRNCCQYLSHKQLQTYYISNNAPLNIVDKIDEKLNETEKKLTETIDQCAGIKMPYV